MPILSLILPVYKVEPFLGACLDSILSALDRVEAKESVEVICVDDGSPDRCGEILESYRERFAAAAKGVRVDYVVVHQPNGGVSSARNEGLRRARGEWIWFVDSDDSISSFALAFLTRVLREHPVDILRFGNQYVPAQDAPFPSAEQPLAFYDLTRDADVRRAFQHHLTGLLLWHACYRRETIGDVRFREDLQLGEDALFATQVVVRSSSLATTDTMLYNYVQHQGSCVATMNLKKIRCALETIPIRMDVIRAWPLGAAALPFQFKSARNGMCGVFVAMRKLGFDACRSLLPRYFEAGDQTFAGHPFYQVIFRSQSLLAVFVFLYLPWKVRVSLLRLGLGTLLAKIRSKL